MNAYVLQVGMVMTAQSQYVTMNVSITEIAHFLVSVHAKRAGQETIALFRFVHKIVTMEVLASPQIHANVNNGKVGGVMVDPREAFLYSRFQMVILS